MHGFGYEPDPVWKPFAEDRRDAATGRDMKNLALENAPGVVFGQIGLILVAALGFALVVNLLLFAFDLG